MYLPLKRTLHSKSLKEPSYVKKSPSMAGRGDKKVPRRILSDCYNSLMLQEKKLAKDKVRAIDEPIKLVVAKPPLEDMEEYREVDKYRCKSFERQENNPEAEQPTKTFDQRLNELWKDIDKVAQKLKLMEKRCNRTSRRIKLRQSANKF